MIRSSMEHKLMIVRPVECTSCGQNVPNSEKYRRSHCCCSHSRCKGHQFQTDVEISYCVDCNFPRLSPRRHCCCQLMSQGQVCPCPGHAVKSDYCAGQCSECGWKGCICVERHCCCAWKVCQGHQAREKIHPFLCTDCGSFGNPWLGIEVDTKTHCCCDSTNYLPCGKHTYVPI